jgi:uncharacterized membrane protein
VASSTRRVPGWLSAVLGILAVILIVIAIIYFVEPAHSLPSFFPGHTKHGTKERTKHGIAAVVIGVVLLALALVASGRSRRRRRF